MRLIIHLYKTEATARIELAYSSFAESRITTFLRGQYIGNSRHMVARYSKNLNIPHNL